MWLFVAQRCFLPYTIFFSNTLNHRYCAQPSFISIESSSMPGGHMQIIFNLSCWEPNVLNGTQTPKTGGSRHPLRT